MFFFVGPDTVFALARFPDGYELYESTRGDNDRKDYYLYGERFLTCLISNSNAPIGFKSDGERNKFTSPAVRTISSQYHTCGALILTLTSPGLRHARQMARLRSSKRCLRMPILLQQLTIGYTQTFESGDEKGEDAERPVCAEEDVEKAEDGDEGCGDVE